MLLHTWDFIRTKAKTDRCKFQVSRTIVDLTSDAITDCSSDESFAEKLSPVRRVHKLLSTAKVNPKRKKKMPPELKIFPVPVKLFLKQSYVKFIKIGIMSGW